MTAYPTWQDITSPGNATDFFQRTRMQPFDLSADGYSPRNARWLMELSRLVYRHDIEETPNPPKPTRTEFLNKAGFRQIDFFQHKKDEIDTQAMLVASAQSDFAVLVFRGTEPIGDELITPDLWTDLKVWKRSFSNLKKANPLTAKDKIQIHAGFVDALDAIWRDIEAKLAALNCPVYFTGHSLGAALATLAAARPLPPGCILKGVYAFASPRVGNRAFAASLAQQPIYRVVHGRDMVTRLPPERFGFAHAGRKYKLRSTFRSWFRLSPFKCLADHAPIGYVDHIK